MTTTTTTATALDFRDILQHPPAIVQANQPLPADSAWDAHRVLFNEREKDVDQKGDEFDDFFVAATTNEGFDAVAAAAILEATKEECDKDTADATNHTMTTTTSEINEELDPLGWPVDDFRTVGGFNEDNDDEDNEDDGLDLLRRRSDEDVNTGASELTAPFGGMTLFTQMVESESMLEENDNHPNGHVVDKAERIRSYETTGVDDDSSVEEEVDQEEEDEWEKDRDVSYIVQSTSNDDDDDDEGYMAVPPPQDNDDNLELIDPEETRAGKVPQFSAETAASSDAATKDAVAAAALPTFTIPPTTQGKRKKTSGIVPLIQPPPAEKFQKWEEAQARALEHLQSSEK